MSGVCWRGGILGWEGNSQVIPPLSTGSIPLKEERRMVTLRITSRELLLESDEIHALRAMQEVSGGLPRE